MLENIQEMLNEGIAYMRSGRFELAEQVFKNILEEDKKCLDAYIHLGNAYVNQNKLEEAIKAFKTAVLLQPEQGEIYYQIGCVYFLKNDWLRAVEYFNKAEEKDYKIEALYLMKAAIYQQSEDYVQAVREMSKAIEQKPFKAELYVRKAHLQADLGHLESAVETGEQLRERMPDALEGYELGVWLACAGGHYEKALVLAEQGRACFPLDPAFLLLKVDIFRAKNDYKNVKETADEVLKFDLSMETRLQVVIYQAEAYGQLGQLQDMKKLLEAYRKEDQNGKISFMLMLLYMSEKEYEKAKEVSVKLQELDAGDHLLAAAKFSYAEAVLHTEGMEKAKSLYKSLTKELRAMTIKDPGLYEGYIYRLLSHAALDEYAEAMDLADFLEKAYPEMADGHLYKYYIYTKMGKTAEAQEEKEKALEINPNIQVQW